MPTVNSNDRIRPDSPVTWADLFGNSGSKMNTPRMDVTLTYGKINLSASSMSVTALRVVAPFIKDSAINTATRSKGASSFTLATSSPANIGGSFSTERVAHPEGTVILLQLSTSRPLSGPMRAGKALNSRRLADGGLFLRLRRDASFIMVTAKLPTGRESILGDSIAVFQGNADILNPEELSMYGIQVNRGYVSSYMDPEQVREVMEVQEVTKGVPRPQLQKVVSNGKVVVKEVAQEPTRRIIRRR